MGYYTPQKFNMEPQNGDWEDDVPFFKEGIFRCYVSFQGE